MAYQSINICPIQSKKMLTYGSSEHKCQPCPEQDLFIDGSSEHEYHLNSEQNLLIDNSLEHECLPNLDNVGCQS